MEHIIESSTGHFLQQFYTSLTQEELPMQTLNTAMLSTNANPQNIDHMVEMEMRRIQENCSRTQEQYVEQMLLENPITIERRTMANRHQLSPQHQEQSQPYPVDTAVSKVTNSLPLDQQQQRADACRRSRYNNKIKKAKSQFRHKYMSQKLLQSTQMFNCIQDLIAQAENHLLAQGLTKDKLHQLRHSYGVDKTRHTVSNLELTVTTDQ